MNSSDGMLAALYRDQYRPLSAYVRRRLRRGETDDFVQEAFLHLLRSGDPERLSHPRSYLYQIVSNLIVDSQRKGRHREQRLVEDVDVDNLPLERSDHRQAADAMMRASFVQIKLREMPEKCRAVYLMHQIEGKTCSEIAEQLDISPRTVNRMMNRVASEFCVAQ